MISHYLESVSGSRSNQMEYEVQEKNMLSVTQPWLLCTKLQWLRWINFPDGKLSAANISLLLAQLAKA